MSLNRQHRQTYSFVVRLWFEPCVGTEVEVRGRVQDVRGGEVIYFRTWADLVTVFETMLVAARPPPAVAGDTGSALDEG